MTSSSPWPPPPPSGGSTPSFTAQPASTPRPSGPMVVFQFASVVLFLVAGVWVTMGRFFFNAGGWYGVIMLFTVLPIIAIYGIVLEIIVAVRYTKSGFVMRRWTTTALVAALIGLLVAGFTIIDFGDAPDSIGSVLTRVLQADPAGPVGTASSLIALGGLGVAVVGMIAGFVLIFVEKPRPASTSA